MIVTVTDYHENRLWEEFTSHPELQNALMAVALREFRGLPGAFALFVNGDLTTTKGPGDPMAWLMQARSHVDPTLAVPSPDGLREELDHGTV